MNIDLNKYKDFVAVVTSNQSNDLKAFVDNAHTLEKQAAVDGILSIAIDCRYWIGQ